MDSPVRPRGTSGGGARVLEVNDLMAVSQASPLISALSATKEIGTVKISDKSSGGSSPSSRCVAGFSGGASSPGRPTTSTANVRNESNNGDAGTLLGGSGAGALFTKEDVVSHLAVISRAAPDHMRELQIDIHNASSSWLSELPSLLQNHHVDSLSITVNAVGTDGGEAISEIIAPPNSTLKSLSVASKSRKINVDEVEAMAEGLRSNGALAHFTLHNVEDGAAACRVITECCRASVMRNQPLVVNINVGDEQEGSTGGIPRDNGLASSSGNVIVATIQPSPRHAAMRAQVVAAEKEESDAGVSSHQHSAVPAAALSGGGTAAGGVVRPVITFGGHRALRRSGSGSSGGEAASAVGTAGSQPVQPVAAAGGPATGAGHRGGGGSVPLAMGMGMCLPAASATTGVLPLQPASAGSAAGTMGGVARPMLGRQDTGGGVEET